MHSGRTDRGRKAKKDESSNEKGTLSPPFPYTYFHILNAFWLYLVLSVFLMCIHFKNVGRIAGINDLN